MKLIFFKNDVQCDFNTTLTIEWEINKFIWKTLLRSPNCRHDLQYPLGLVYNLQTIILMWFFTLKRVMYPQILFFLHSSSKLPQLHLWLLILKTQTDGCLSPTHLYLKIHHSATQNLHELLPTPNFFLRLILRAHQPTQLILNPLKRIIYPLQTLTLFVLASSWVRIFT